MLLYPQIRPADSRHWYIQNIIGYKGNFLWSAILQRLVRIDSTYYGFVPAGITNQYHAVLLSVVGKSTAFKNSLHRGHVPFKFNDAWCFYLAAYIHPPRCKLVNGHNDFRVF